MAFVSNLLGGGGVNGLTPQGTSIIPGANQGQANTAYDQTQQGLANQAAFVNATGAQNGLQNQSDVFSQLQGVANGQGPNPAQAALANATGANTANQAALMAGQRGAGANAGMIARQAGQQGAANQQAAIGQGAALQAQQSLGAIGQMGNIAGQQVNQQAGALQGYNAAAQGQQGNILGAINNQNNANVAMQSNINNANQQQAGRSQGVVGGVLGGISSGLGMLGGGSPGSPDAPSGGMPKTDAATGIPMNLFAQGGAVPHHGLAHIRSMYSKGGAVDAMVSPGEIYLDPSKAQAVARGAMSPMAGEKIPGQAQVSGNSYSNDTVEKTLQAGGVVIPRSVLQAKNPQAAAAAFVKAHLASKGKR